MPLLLERDGPLARLPQLPQIAAMESSDGDWIEAGGVASPAGFLADGVYTGVKTYGPEPRLDLGVLHSDRPAAAAGVFTQSRVPGAPVLVSKEHVRDGRARALVVNSGCSNVATGPAGLQDARTMCDLTAGRLGVVPEEVLVCSTGVIGRRLPMQRITEGIDSVTPTPTRGGGEAFARAIMTTDTRPKACALERQLGGVAVRVGGVVKGSGMAHPDMATVFAFLTTDAAVEPGLLSATLKRVADVSLNMVDIDMDTSTSDSMLVFANGAAGGELIRSGSAEAGALEAMLTQVSIYLAKELARDGEGAKTLIEVVVEGAADDSDARLAARTITSSPLIKTMVTGRDPNLGRVMMALGRSGAAIDVSSTSVFIGERCAFRNGAPSDEAYEDLAREMEADEVLVRVTLGLGSGAATAWGCDLTEGYVRINADYTT